ncbi:hypothetical protein MRX96_047695, partial [Rhipicephalus microplus]
ETLEVHKPKKKLFNLCCLDLLETYDRSRRWQTQDGHRAISGRRCSQLPARRAHPEADCCERHLHRRLQNRQPRAGLELFVPRRLEGFARLEHRNNP